MELILLGIIALLVAVNLFLLLKQKSTSEGASTLNALIKFEQQLAQIEKQVAVKVAAKIEDMVAEEQEAVGFGNQQDPLVAIKQRELDLDEQKINLDAADDLAKRKLEEDKLVSMNAREAARLAQQQNIQNQRSAIQRERINASKKR